MTTCTTRRLTAFVLVACLGLTACWGDDGGEGDDGDGTPSTSLPDDSPTEPVVAVEGRTDEGTGRPLGIRLSEGEAVAAPAEPIDVVAGSELTPDEVRAVLDRLPAWDVPADDVTEVSFPAETLLPPLTGGTIDTEFPPPPAPAEPAPDAGPLDVLRFQPEGTVDTAPFISVTFDQPMVPLTTLDQLDVTDVPAVVTPAIEGRWRWIGTRTLRFELVPGELDRLPGATDYTVEIPAGTTAANGAVLAEAVSWTFSTPPVGVVDFVGDESSLPLEPVFVATFDQRVDAEAVLATIEVEADGDTVDLRLATEAEIGADEAAADAVARALPDRAVAFRPVEPLPADTDLSIAIGPGTPSAEGPTTTTEVVSFPARTFGAFDIVRSLCDSGWGCTPGTPFTVEFTNAIDPDAFSADLVTVSPAIPSMRIDVYDSVLSIGGVTDGRTTYTVTVAGGLQDVFGQTLGTDRTVEFDVGSAPPELRGFTRPWITTDPTAERPTLTVSSINHDEFRVRAWAVGPQEITAFWQYLERRYSDADSEVPSSWPLVLDETVPVDAEEDRWAETPVELADAVAEAGSQLVVEVSPTLEFSDTDEDYWRNVPTVAWVQTTTLGIDAFSDGRRLVLWTTDLTTGDPVAGVPVELLGDGRVVTTDDDGLAEVELSSDTVTGLWADTGDRTALLTQEWWGGWTTQQRTDEPRWYVFDDRGVYRPGETARLTGWVRNFAWTRDAQLALWEGATAVRYRVVDPQGVELANGTTDLDRLGGFDLAVEIPEGANLGYAWVELSLDGLPGYTAGSHQFQIQEYRRPEFEVTARTESPAPYYAAEPATVAVDAEYFAGGALPNADVEWLVSTGTTSYSPPNWDDFVFGVWTPWWFAEAGRPTGGAEMSIDVAAPAVDDGCFDCWPVDDRTYEQFSGRTDAGGTHYLQIAFDGPEVDLPSTVTAEATVFDVDRQAWASRVDLLVHAARLYVGLRTDRPFVELGDPIRVDAVVTDVDGSVAPGNTAEVTAGRVEWVRDAGEWVERLADEQTCTVESTDDPADGSMRCEFTTEVGGEYRIVATVTDDTGRSNRTELTQWVSGGSDRPTRLVEQGTVTIVPDADSYQPGDTAQLLVRAPFAPADGIVTIARGDIVSTEAFSADDGSAVVEIPIEEAWIPNITVQVDMVGSAERTDDEGTPRPDLPRRSAFATGTIDLPIPPLSRTLTVTATPAATAVEPGTDTSVTVAVTGADGAPVEGADVALVVVDEAVLSVVGYELLDPVSVFYRHISTYLMGAYSRSSIVLARSDLTTGGRDDGTDGAVEEEAAEEPTAAGGETADAAPNASVADTAAVAEAAPIELRTDFDALAVYAPSETTGPDGTVTVDVPLPDTVTRYRVMAVAVDGVDRFGSGESTLTARLPLQVRPSAPRFANYGDRFEFPVVVQNQTDQPMEVDVVVETANLDLTGPTGRRVAVPANDRVEVRFPVAVADVGTARFRIAAVSDTSSDAVAGSLPVYTPATSEAFATYGVVDDGAVGQPIVPPADVLPGFGGLEIGTSSTAVQALTDAVLYLVQYPYDSTDGYASRIMAVAALRDVLTAFDAEGLPEPDTIDNLVAADIDRLAALQNDDGGWSWFQRGRETIAFQSIQATHALVVARDADYPVPGATLDLALARLATIEDVIPPDTSDETRDTLSAYALYVRNLAGQPDAAKATALYERAADRLGLDALAWLWSSIDDPGARSAIERAIRNAAVETAGAAVFATDYAEDAWVIAQSERRTDGIVLDALITETPDSDLVPKAVSGLIGNQVAGRWNNAYENAFILLALHRYFTTFEDVTPDFVARAWLGDLYTTEAVFSGRTTERVNTLVPMDEVLAAGDSTIVVAKEGEGRLYYRLGLTYAPADLALDPRDEGFVVDRVYEAVDDPADVTRDTDGTWRIRPGATVRVTVTMVADAQRTGVALVDPLPAGLEPLNPALAISSTVPPGDTSGGAPEIWSWWWSWFEHQNLRDDRVEAFASYLPGGTYEYSYVARATTPGEFVVPPARAEEMYAPEVFGRSASARVVVG